MLIFVNDLITYREPVPGQYQFSLNGTFRKLRKNLIDRLIGGKGSTHMLQERVTAYQVDEEDIMRQLFAVRDACDIRDRRLTHCYIGSKQFKEIARLENEDTGVLDFTVDSNSYRLLGYRLTVLPYMDGILFV